MDQQFRFNKKLPKKVMGKSFTFMEAKLEKLEHQIFFSWWKTPKLVPNKLSLQALKILSYLESLEIQLLYKSLIY